MRIVKCLSGVAAIALLGCSLAASPASAQNKATTLVYGNTAGPETLDPYVGSSTVDLEVVHHIFEGLVGMDGNYAAKPMLASKVDVASDGKTFTFVLRHGVKFHNGKEMTSADVQASFERYRRISPNAAVLADVESFEAPDPFTFIIHLKKTNAVFLDVLKSPVYPFVILPAEQKDKPAREVEIIGTGPFKLGEWRKDSHLTIEKFDSYVADESGKPADGLVGRKTVNVGSVRYRFMPEANARIAALQTGEADIISNVPRDLVGRIEGRPDLQVNRILACQQYFIVNTQQPPTDSVQMRQAIRAAVGVDDMIGAISRPAKRSHSMTISGGEYYGGDINNEFYDQKNPKLAGELAKQAGYKPDQKLKLMTTATYPEFRDAILVLSEQLKEAGITSDVQMVDWATNASNMQSGNGGWNISSTSFCSNPNLGPQQWKFMVYNFPHVKNDAELDAAYDKFYTSLALDDRKAAWRVIEKRVLEQAYMIKIADIGVIQALNRKRLPDFRDFYINRFWNVSLK
ncbi:ABC transporter substrate-binding protein [Bradyrhizobium ganzhouense]|uniref:ABC transporter substrate-binding protein n=1 Tax=Bradyrhizobium ganzhouense TaxID=1179767 RepID=UPI003CF46ADB